LAVLAKPRAARRKAVPPSVAVTSSKPSLRCRIWSDNRPTNGGAADAHSMARVPSRANMRERRCGGARFCSAVGKVIPTSMSAVRWTPKTTNSASMLLGNSSASALKAHAAQPSAKVTTGNCTPTRARSQRIP
jgi:hypothetical protein